MNSEHLLERYKETSAKSEIEKLLKIEDLAKLHQSVFEDIYNLAFRQEEGWEDSPATQTNPQLFIQVEQILSPLYSAWREKYALIRQAITEGRVPYCEIIKKFVLEDQAGKNELYYINHGEKIKYGETNYQINYDLQIRKPGIWVRSDPITQYFGQSESTFYREEVFKFFAGFSDNRHSRKVNLKITEITGGTSNPSHYRDCFSLQLDEEITPLIAPRYYLGTSPFLQRHTRISVWRPSQSDILQPRRLVEDLTGIISSLGFKIQREAFFKK